MRLTFHLVGFFIALFVAFTAAADDENPEQNRLRFITIEVSPWAYSSPDGQSRSGAFIKMVREIEARTPYRIDVTLTPFARVDRELEAGSHDCTILIPRSEQIVKLGELVSFHEIGVVPRPGVTLDAYEDLADLKIAVLRGAAITERFDRDESLNKVYDTDYLMSVRKLARHRVDAIAGAIPTIRYLADTNGFGDKIGQALTLENVPLMFQCSLRSAHLDAMQAINTAIADMKDDGTIESIRQEYYF